MGPLTGLRILEIEGLGPAPFAGMMFADMGAEVISITRKSAAADAPINNSISERGKKSIALNLKDPRGVEAVLKLCESADALIEGFRPGVAERLGIGPNDCAARNPKLVYGRMTGWGQTGPLSNAAGHDINYISLSGALHAMGREGDNPLPPLNLVGDFGGGGMFLAFGVVSALLEATRSGKGQVVDTSMVEGSAALMHMMYSLFNHNMWADKRGVNVLDTGAHFYETYETSDNKYVSIGSIEPQFYQILKEKLQLDANFEAQLDENRWPEMKDKLKAIFKTKTRDQWCELLEGSDVCFAPILSMKEAPHHPHNVDRKSFIEINGDLQPGPAPKFSRTTPSVSEGAPRPGSHTNNVLQELAGYEPQQLDELRAQGVLT
ncbi:Acetyl-CoA:oxalate CoA-transferase [Zhongshania aliphaticivorans]|uniref:Acetyl-CoA:oxalate CoA-transferase n=1 Tax=Zhongshania aliphaticivorans TaxID=1470434 RepID=A0A5S9P783_9GAMM|nr:CaiB/BaiF CoA-transferase family protein [Zhongshania aliphaticivorans]CAA0092094.1 Acetyl-CoA:oxalate CoA-transferase [Zhongshania aliphaticivorans]CAA0099422.1 Acetyl-CoA:oxalate CoA-transferase [Zhongshania aliphaticivorans]